MKLFHRDVGLAAALALGILSVGTYHHTLSFGLVWDDPMLLTQVARVGHTGGADELFRSDFRLAADRPLGYYRPVTTLSLWLQTRDVAPSAGADALQPSARALHTGNVILHLICVLLVWLLLRRLVRHEWAAWLGAALFAVHPAHVESVAFVSARTDLLAALFVLSSTLCWLFARAGRGARRNAAIACGALLALAGALSKEQALLLPLVLVAWSFLPRKWSHGWWRGNRAWLGAWLAAVAVALLLRAQAGVGFGGADSQSDAGAFASFFQLGLPALALYLRLWFLPWPLNSYYMPHDIVPGWPNLLGVAGAVVLIGFAIRAGRGREVLAACAFVVVFLLPVLHLAPLGGAVAAERFFYLSSAGLALLTSLALVSLELSPVARRTSRAVAALAIVAGFVLCQRGARAWESDATLYARMVEVAPRAAVAHRGYAEVLTREGHYAEAAQSSRRAIELDPNYADAYELLGVVSARQGDFESARAAFETVRELHPRRVSSHTNLGVLAFNEGDLQAAAEHLRRAAELDPESPGVHYYLGNVLAELGDVEGARREAAILDRLDPARARELRQTLERKTLERPDGEGESPR